MQKEKLFFLPEQMAVAEVLRLIQQEKMKIVNFEFFSRIESFPLKPITDPVERETNHEMYDPGAPYLRTTIVFYCRGTKVAVVIMEGSVMRGADCWRTAKIRARKYYWRNDKDEDQTWGEFAPIHQLYGSIRAGTDGEEKQFLGELGEVLQS